MLRQTSVWVLGTLVQSLMLARQALYTLSHLPFCPRLPYCHTQQRRPGKRWAPYLGSLEHSAKGTRLPFPQSLSDELCGLDQISWGRFSILWNILCLHPLEYSLSPHVLKIITILRIPNSKIQCSPRPWTS